MLKKIYFQCFIWIKYVAVFTAVETEPFRIAVRSKEACSHVDMCVAYTYAFSSLCGVFFCYFQSLLCFLCSFRVFFAAVCVIWFFSLFTVCCLFFGNVWDLLSLDAKIRTLKVSVGCCCRFACLVLWMYTTAVAIIVAKPAKYPIWSFAVFLYYIPLLLVYVLSCGLQFI